MEFSGRLFLAFIEEDNAQRSLFRVRPLLSEEGGISQEETDTLGDEGFLRVVPDRGEQHVFKERMRELGQLCLIDLRNVPAEVSKVRNNKNYSPNLGETNRYVIYSDAIHSLHETEIYEVVAEGRAAVPDTTTYYLRKGGHIQGPFSAESSEPAAPLSCIAPDNNRLYCVTMPDGRECLYYWPEPLVMPSVSPEALEPIAVQQQEEVAVATAPVPEEEPQVEVLPVEEKEEPTPTALMSAKDKILEIQAAISPLLEVTPQEEELPPQPEEEPQRNRVQKAEKLGGTPMRMNAGKPAGARRDSLNLSSIVDREVRRSGRPQEPSASLSDAHDLRHVDNPAEQFKQAMRQLWAAKETRNQAIESFIAMDGATQAVCDKLSGEGAKVMKAVSHQQLNDLEAERLSLVMELDALKKNRAELIKEALIEGGRQAQELESYKAQLEQALDQIKGECEELKDTRAELIEELTPLLGKGRYVAPGFGEDCSFEKATKLIAQVFGGAGFAVTKNDAANLLLMTVLFEQVALEGDDKADARLAVLLMARALGAALAECEAGETPVVLPGGDGLVLALHENSQKGMSKANETYHSLFIADNTVLPCVQVQATPGFMMEQSLRTGICARKEFLHKAIAQAQREIPSDALALLSQAESSLHRGMPLALKRDIIKYLASAQSLLEGGIAAALDYAFAGFIIPFAKRHHMDITVLRSLCAAMPVSSNLL